MKIIFYGYNLLSKKETKLVTVKRFKGINLPLHLVEGRSVVDKV